MLTTITLTPEQQDRLQVWIQTHGPAFYAAMERSAAAWLQIAHQVRQAQEESAPQVLRLVRSSMSSASTDRE